MNIQNNIEIDIDNPHQLDIPCLKDLRAYLEQILNYLNKNSAEVNVYIADEAEIKHLNNQHRQQNKATNILSFPFERPIGLPPVIQENFIGDLAICPVIIIQEATEQQKKLQAHWAHIFMHGILHLYNYDHVSEKEAKIMESLEIKLLHQLGFENPYTETEYE